MRRRATKETFNKQSTLTTEKLLDALLRAESTFTYTKTPESLKAVRLARMAYSAKVSEEGKK